MRRILLIILSVFLLVHCWNKQKHDITRPLIPSYVFDGHAVDMDTFEPMPNAQIKLDEIHMLYEVKFGTQIITADSTGYFKFDSVYPGDYYLSMERDGYFIKKSKISYPHSDTTLTLEIPHVFIAKSFPQFRATNQAIAIIGTECWSINWGLKETLEDGTLIFQDFFHVFTLAMKEKWVEDEIIYQPLKHLVISGMAFARDGIYACVNRDSLYLINRGDGTFSNKIKVGTNVKGVSLHIGRKTLFTCFENQLHEHDLTDPTQILNEYETDFTNLRSLAYYRNLYSFDNESYILREYDENINPVKSYNIVLEHTQNNIEKIYDMSFDGYGSLWVIVQ